MSAKTEKRRLYRKRRLRRQRRAEAERQQAAAQERGAAEFEALFQHLNDRMREAAGTTHPHLRSLVGTDAAETARLVKAAGREESFKAAWKEICGDEFVREVMG